MDNARQIIRWAIPGWAFLIFLFFFMMNRYAISQILLGRFGNLEISNLLITYKDVGSGFVLILGAAGIPIGYVLYQIYFWRYWQAFRIPFGPLIVGQLDRSKEILSGVSLTQDEVAKGMSLNVLFVPRIKYWNKGGPLRYVLPKVHYVSRDDLRQLGRSEFTASDFRIHVRKNWVTVLSFWYKRVAEPSSAINNYISYLFDIYHSQGATRAGLELAFVLSLAYDLIAYFHENLVYWPVLLATLAVNWSIFFIIFNIFASLRGRNHREINELMQNFIKMRNQ